MCFVSRVVVVYGYKLGRSREPFDREMHFETAITKIESNRANHKPCDSAIILCKRRGFIAQSIVCETGVEWNSQRRADTYPLRDERDPRQPNRTTQDTKQGFCT